MTHVTATVENPDKLPTKELGTILDRLGLEDTWKSVIATHVEKTRPAFKTTIGAAAEFANAEILDRDFIKGLTLGETSILYEFSLAHVDRSSRKQEGQYFTPDDVAVFLAEQSDGFPNGVWLDPCSGIGNLSYRLADKQDDKESFVLNNLKLVDRDPIALLIARALFALNFQDKRENLFADIAKNFVLVDFLETAELPEHDFAILNPPYVAVKADTRFKSAKARDLYAYFVERVAVSSKGFISITPQSFTNSGKFADFRQVLLDNFDNADIYAFDNVPDTIFKGVKFGSHNTNKVNSTRAAVIVARPNDTSETGYRITPLLRWRTSERQRMLAEAGSFLTPFKATKEIFPKTGKGLTTLHRLLTNGDSTAKSLSTYLSKYPTEFSLIVPSTPRYFIPAVKRSLERSSFKQIYFKNQEDMDKLYPYLNSSALYWWWRVNDGGMTLSSETLHSLPVPGNLIKSDLLSELLEKSEQENIVIKMNAGKPNENVKHDLTLIAKLNEHVFPDHANELLKTHNNSHFL